METVIQLLMGTSLAACAGLRAWLPMLVVGLLARANYVHLGPAFDFLERTDALVIFGVATVVELLADKVIAVDHFLDGISTFVRPAVGTVLAASMLAKVDPVAATVLGLIVGGGTAFTVHAGKTVARYKCSALSMFHGGTGNAALSFIEDFASGFGVLLAAFAPIFAFILAIAVLAAAVWLLRKGAEYCRKGLLFIRQRRESIEP
jgi:uncharacterized protein DUF4126